MVAPKKGTKETKPAAPAPTGMFAELSKATGVKPRAGEKYAVLDDKQEIQGYAVRLSEGVSNMSEDAQAKLSKLAIAWFDKSVEAINANDLGALPKLSGFPAPAGKPATKTAAATKPAAAKGNGAKKGQRTDGVAYKMRMAVIKKPNISFEDAAAKIGADAKIGGHAWNIWSEASKVMGLVAQAAA